MKDVTKMKNKRLPVKTFLLVFALVVIISGVAYGYWVEQVQVEGNIPIKYAVTVQVTGLPQIEILPLLEEELLPEEGEEDEGLNDGLTTDEEGVDPSTDPNGNSDPDNSTGSDSNDADTNNNGESNNNAGSSNNDGATDNEGPSEGSGSGGGSSGAGDSGNNDG